MSNERRLKALKLLEAVSEECDVMTDGDHVWRKCRACLARFEFEDKQVRELIRALLAEVRQQGSGIKWRPIAEAEEFKAEDQVLLLAPSYAKPVVAGTWDDEQEAEGGQCWRACDCTWDRLNPTHFAEMPPPPSDPLREP